MKFEEIEELWEVDSYMDPTDIGNVALNIANLHNKYFRILNQEKRLLIKMERAISIRQLEIYNILRYGPTSKEDEQHLPASGILNDGSSRTSKVLANDIKTHLDGNQELCKMAEQISIQLHKVKYLEDIIKQLTNRNFAIKNFIDWEKIKNGI